MSLCLIRNFLGGGSNGAKAAPQQSKLAFSNKSCSTEAASDKQEEEELTNGVVKEEQEDVNMDGDEGEHEDKPEPATLNGANGSASPGRKRRASEDSALPSDEEPPVKRKRLQRGRKTKVESDEEGDDKPVEKPKIPKVKEEPATQMETPKQAKSPSKAKKGRKSVTFAEEAVDEDKSSGIKRRATPKKPSKAEVKEEDDEVEEAVPSSAAKVNPEEPAKDDESEQSASEHDEEGSEVEEEEEKPEQAAKARQTVQSTLSTKTKDPYPDWKPGEPVPYAALCTTFSKIEMTTKRLEIAAHCSLFLRQVLRLTPDDLLPVVFLMIGKLTADYAGIELGIGESLIKKAIGEATGRSNQVIEKDQQELGDLGLVAAKSRSNQPTMFKPKPLSLRGVHETLMSIATTEGQGAQAKKIGGIKKLLSAADAHTAGKGTKGVDVTQDKGGPSESKFIIRSLEGKMRLGLAEKTVLVALSQAMVFHEIMQNSDKAPSTDQLAKGETVLKSVFK